MINQYLEKAGYLPSPEGFVRERKQATVIAKRSVAFSEVHMRLFDLSCNAVIDAAADKNIAYLLKFFWSASRVITITLSEGLSTGFRIITPSALRKLSKDEGQIAGLIAELEHKLEANKKQRLFL